MSLTRPLALALLAASILAALTLSPARAVETRSCAWTLQADPSVLNALYPDEAAQYWVLALPLLPGQQLVLRGRYPHSRYMSFASYDPALRSADSLHDAQIEPDRGSLNPFRTGADRTATARNYTVKVTLGRRPAAPAPNTLYTASADGSRTGLTATVIYRNYRSDDGYGADGGVGLPRVSVRTGAIEVPLPACTFPTIPSTGLNDTIASASPPVPYPPLLGSATPPWRKFYNLPTSAAYFTTNTVTGSALGDLLAPLTTATAQGGFADNPDNSYVATVLNSGHGEVAVIRAQMPTFPDTRRGTRTMPAGQLRYWSLCSEEFVTGRYYDCLVDDEVPLTADRSYTVMVSTAAARPGNARPECGIAWLPTGPAPDTVLLLRNMLADPAFTHSVQRARLDHEQDDLGPYYPATEYLTRTQAEALGCTAS